MGVVARAGRGTWGLAVGALTSVLHVVLLVVMVGALLVPRARPAVAAGAVGLAGAEQRRVEWAFGDARSPDARGSTTDGTRALGYLAARVPAGLLGGTVLGLIGAGLLVAATILLAWGTGSPWALDSDPTVITGGVVAAYLLPGVVLLYLALTGAVGVARWERSLVRWLHAPSREQLAERVEVLAESRAAVVAAVDDERRRIERDLHDGVQQRVVALGMLLGRARRHPEAAELLAQAHEESQRVLTDLRDVSWRVYPAALDTDGLGAALESIAERAPLPVRITCALPAEPPPAVRTAAWFVVCEAVTNAAKHSGASAVAVEVGTVAGLLRATVHDDGRGGADPTGGGLSGLARRVAAADGTLTVVSPPGGPTVVTAELPCG